MEALRRFQGWVTRRVTRAAGYDTQPPRLTFGMQRATGLEGDIQRLPLDFASYTPLQNDQGVFFFEIDGSPVDGADIIQ